MRTTTRLCLTAAIVFAGLLVQAFAAVDDGWVSAQAQSALGQVKGLPKGLTASSASGLVTLQGDVKTVDQRSLAERTVAGIPGVSGVRNMLRVVGTPSAPPARPAKSTAPAKPAPAFAPAPPEPEVARNPVETPAPEIKPPTVVAVDATPIIRPDAGAQDAQIRQAIVDAIRDVSPETASDITVEVRDGNVRLTGAVPSWQGNNERLHAVRSVPGVRTISNEVRVAGLNN